MNDRSSLATLFVLSWLLPTPAFAEGMDLRGPCLISIGHLERDGLRDTIVADRSSNCSESVWLLSSASGAILRKVAGALHGDGFGWSLAEIGDVDSDRVPDFAVGAVGTCDLQEQHAADGRRLPPHHASNGYARVISSGQAGPEREGRHRRVRA